MENSSKCFRPRQLTLWRRMSNHWNKQNRFWEPLHAEVIRLTIDIGKMCDRGWYHASEHFTKHLDMADGGTNVGTAHPSFLVCCLFPVCPQTDTAQLCKTQSDLCLRTPHLDQIGHESSIVFSLKQVSSWHHTWLRTRHLNIYTNTVALALSATCHVCRLPTRCFFHRTCPSWPAVTFLKTHRFAPGSAARQQVLRRYSCWWTCVGHLKTRCFSMEFFQFYRCWRCFRCLTTLDLLFCWTCFGCVKNLSCFVVGCVLGLKTQSSKHVKNIRHPKTRSATTKLFSFQTPQTRPVSEKLHLFCCWTCSRNFENFLILWCWTCFECLDT